MRDHHALGGHVLEVRTQRFTCKSRIVRGANQLAFMEPNITHAAALSGCSVLSSRGGIRTGDGVPTSVGYRLTCDRSEAISIKVDFSPVEVQRANAPFYARRPKK
jgi:hypothetical protein